jgi:hypothetical protein
MTERAIPAPPDPPLSSRGMGRQVRLVGVAAVFATLGLPRPAAAESYALSNFHFNVQYVAGGLVGFPGYTAEQRPEETEDQIVLESLLPVLELYAAHPTWGFNVEMQGYLLDVLAARHPDVLDLLRDLAMSGQAEVVSFHYSDQLFIAYPEIDWARSQALTEATFAAHDVPLGTSVFCQEGQSGMGLAAAMAERRYTTMIWPKNLWIEQHGDFDPAPLYRFGDVTMIAGALGVAYQDGAVEIDTTWTFFDDGELLATGDWNPYFPEQFVIDQAALDEYEAGLMGLEAQGFVISTVQDYVAAVEGLVTPAEPPPLFDGTWQPGSTNGVAKWMGDRSLWAIGGRPHDRDNHVRTLGYVAHRELAAAETAAAVAGIDAREQLDAGWRLLALGQVTDASGINPYRGEVEYGLSHLAEATRIARDVIVEAKASAGIDGPATIDPEAGTLAAGDEPPFVGRSTAAVVDVEALADDPAREIETTWEEIDVGHHRVAVRFGPGDEGTEALSVRFAGEATDTLVTTLALDDDTPATFSRADFTFDTWQLAVPLGMVSLAPDLFVIQDAAFVHVAAEISATSGDVRFADQTQAIGEGVTWVFHVFEGSAEEAVALARRINSQRRVVR